MNKADVVGKMAGAAGISKNQANKALGAMLGGVTNALKKGDRVAFVGFGTFSTSMRQARNGRNPQTGKPIRIAARRVARFSAGAGLKKAVNKK